MCVLVLVLVIPSLTGSSVCRLCRPVMKVAGGGGGGGGGGGMFPSLVQWQSL